MFIRTALLSLPTVDRAAYGTLCGVRRIAGIDIARGLALLGMFVSHAAPAVAAGGVGALLITVPDERSRLLFAITAGLGLGLLTGGAKPATESRSVLRGQITVRAFCLLLLGLILQATGVLVYVILDEYGIAFLLMLPLVFLRVRWLLGLGSLLLVIAPGAAFAIAEQMGSGGGYLADWFFAGAYPVFSWVAVMLLGVGLVRLGLDRPVVVATAGAIGIAAMVAGLGLSMALGGDGIRTAPPTAVGTSVFTIGNVGFGVALTMGLVALTTMAGRLAAPVSTVLSPVAAAGSMPLSVYTAHIVVLVAVTRDTPQGFPSDDGWPVVIGLVVGTLTLPWLWRRFIGRGPLEIVISRLSGRDG